MDTDDNNLEEFASVVLNFNPIKNSSSGRCSSSPAGLSTLLIEGQQQNQSELNNSKILSSSTTQTSSIEISNENTKNEKFSIQPADGISKHQLAVNSPDYYRDLLLPQQPVVISGDILFVFRQVGESHLRSCIECSSSIHKKPTGSRPETKQKHQLKTQNQNLKKSENDQQELKKKKSSRKDEGIKKTKGELVGKNFKSECNGGGLYVFYSMHSGFISPESQIFTIYKNKLDIPDEFSDLLSVDLAIQLVLGEIIENKKIRNGTRKIRAGRIKYRSTSSNSRSKSGYLNTLDI